MFFDSRVLHTSKDQEFAGDYEDAFCVDADRGIAAIADGVSSAIFSRQWANLLTNGVVASIPDLYTESAFKDWLSGLRQQWLSEIDIHNLPWNQRQKLQQVGGAFSTLLWMELTPEESSPESDSGTIGFRLRSFAVGDCSLFHIRGNELLRTFPLSTAAEFDADPISICSIDLNRDHQLEFTSIDDHCEPGDLVVLCTDAIGKWAMAKFDAGESLDWNVYWDMPHEIWLEEIIQQRTERAMRYDDTTLVLLRIGGGTPSQSAPAGEETLSVETAGDTPRAATDIAESQSDDEAGEVEPDDDAGTQAEADVVEVEVDSEGTDGQCVEDATDEPVWSGEAGVASENVWQNTAEHCADDTSDSASAADGPVTESETSK